MQQGHKHSEPVSPESQQARVQYILILCALTAFLLVGFISLSFHDWKTAAAVGGGCILLLVPFLLHKAGKHKAANLSLMFIVLASVTGIATVGQGIHDLSVVAYPVVLIYAGLTSDRVFLHLCSGVTFVALLWLALGQVLGLFAPTPLVSDPLNLFYLLTLTVLLSITVFAVDVLSANLRKSLEQSRQEIEERRKAEAALKDSNELFEQFLLHSPIYTYIKEVTSTRSTVFKASENFKDMIGIAGQDMIGKPMEALFPADFASRMAADDWAVITGQQVLRLEEELGGRHYTTIKFPISLQGKDYLAGYTIDITERKNAEHALRENEAKFRAVVENIHDGIILTDAQGIIKYRSPSYVRISGYSNEEQVGRNGFEMIHPDDLPYARRMWRDMLQVDGKIVQAQARSSHRSGSWRWIETTFINLLNNPDVHSVVGVTRDITERKEAEDALRESEQVIEAMLNAIPAGVFWKDTNLAFLGCNRRFAIDAGFSDPREIIGKNDYEIGCPPEEAESYRREDRIMLERGEPRLNVEEFRFLNGRAVGHLTSRVPLRSADGHMRGVLGTYVDITERKKAEAALKESEAKFRSIVQQSADGITVVAEDGTIVEWNRAQEALTAMNRDDVVGRPVWDVQAAFIPAEMNTPQIRGRIETELRAFLKGENDWSDERPERRILLPDGSSKLVRESAFLVRQHDENMGVLILSDITEKKRAEDEKATLEEYLQRAHKLESLGVLAGGIAHDFNNILTGIYGFIEMAMSEAVEPSVGGYLVEAMKSMERARGLTQQLLTFSRGGEPVRKVEKIAPLIMDTCHFSLHGSKLKGRFDVDENLWDCNIDKNQIGQVIQNLMINAVQSMPLGGVIEVAAKNVMMKTGEHPTLPGGAHVRISIKDQGVGISQEMLPRIFDPFFTTKSEGHGLGLAISHSIIARHSGAIDVASELGKGTTFTIHLPACTECQDPSDEPVVARHVGRGVILVMDDEESVRTLLSVMLRSFGYSVVSKPDAESTLECFKTARGRNEQFSAVMLDLTVPGGMGGKEVAAELRKLDTDIPVFVLSGYAVDPVLSKSSLYGVTASLSKPFTRRELMKMLDTYLGKGR